MADEKYEVEVEKDVQDTGQDEKDIEVYDDTPEEDQNREPTAGELEIDEDEISTYGQNVQKRIRQLSKKMHDFRREKEQHLREKEEAIRYAQALVEQNRLYQDQLSRGENILLESHKDRINARIAETERDYKEAYESGDSEKMLAAQKKLAHYTVEQRDVTNYQPRYVQQPSLQQAQNNARIPEVVPDERTKDWVEKNIWFEKDLMLRNAALGVHQELVKDGYTAGSREYFERIDARMREEFPSRPEFRQKKPANVVASASRSTGSTKVKVSQTAVNTAKRLGVPLKEYVEHMMKLQQQEPGNV
jgi:hypothetical protein